MEKKQSNPKDSVGTRKVPLHHVSCAVLLEIGLGMMEGACKYGSHNYRVVGVRASVYYDAAMRHLMAWWEGEDIDPGSGIHHVSKAMSCLSVLRDSMLKGNLTDDRPPTLPEGWLNEMNARAKEIADRFPNPLPPYTKD